MKLHLPEAVLLLFDEERRKAHLAQPPNDGVFRVCLDCSLNDLPGLIANLVRVRGWHEALSPSRQAGEFFCALASFEAKLERDLALADELAEALVHRLHPMGAAGLHRRVDHVGLALADEVAHSRRCGEHFACDHTTDSCG